MIPPVADGALPRSRSERRDIRAARFSRQGVLNRWGLAAALDASLPQVRGRDRLLHLVGGARPPKPLRAEMRARWGPGLEAVVTPATDGSLRALYAAQWVRPALLPILEACLSPGSMFVDVGANVGIYATWAARIVGMEGAVLALEPVPGTRQWLEEICRHNQLNQVTVLPTAAGAREGTARMKTKQGASGLSRVVAITDAGMDVPLTTLDRLLGSRIPSLIKIDVEGHERSVLEGARETLKRTQVPIVFEAPEFGAGSGTLDCVRLLESLGYGVFSLTPGGLRPFAATGYSHNLLAVDRDDRLVPHRLRDARFARCQNT